MARPSRLDNPEFLKAVAMAYVEGWTREQCAEEWGVGSLYTITTWFRDPRVQALAGTLAAERMLRIVRKTDSELERRLQTPGELDVDDIIRIRKEFAPKTAKAGEVGATPATTTSTQEALEDGSVDMEELERIIEEAQAEQDAAFEPEA